MLELDVIAAMLGKGYPKNVTTLVTLVTTVF